MNLNGEINKRNPQTNGYLNRKEVNQQNIRISAAFGPEYKEEQKTND